MRPALRILGGILIAGAMLLMVGLLAAMIWDGGIWTGAGP